MFERVAMLSKPAAQNINCRNITVSPDFTALPADRLLNDDKSTSGPLEAATSYRDSNVSQVFLFSHVAAQA